MEIPRVTLHSTSGHLSMPVIGMETAFDRRNYDPAAIKEAILVAIKTGYRHFDAAEIKVQVLLSGGKVVSWKNEQGEELLFKSRKATGKSPKSFKEGISVCFPQVGSPKTRLGIQDHQGIKDLQIENYGHWITGEVYGEADALTFDGEEFFKDKMENDDKKVENPYPLSVSVTSPTGSSGGLSRQGSITKNNNSTCLCSPTTHAGSFRCRMHRIPGLQRTKSMDQDAHQQHHHSKPDPASTTQGSATISH
ncbi:hypothetical protein AgCh_029950 [Apium graveolens]